MSYCSGGRRSTLAVLCPSSRSPPTPPFPLCTVGTASGFSGTSPPCHLMGPESPHDPATCPLNPKHPSSHGPAALLTPGTRSVFQLRLWAATGRPWGALRGPDSGSAWFSSYSVWPRVVCPRKSDKTWQPIYFSREESEEIKVDFFSIDGGNVTDLFIFLQKNRRTKSLIEQ